VDGDLTPLLKQFGPPRQSYHPEYPFWRLQNDGIWEVHASGPLTFRKGNTDPRKSALLAHQVSASFSAEVQAALRSDPTLVTDIATRLLDHHFLESVHADVLAAVGLTLGMVSTKERKRDP
jgi:putative restriction endonuclease